LEEKCGTAAICFVAFLPDILDSKAEGRNRYLQQLLSVAEKFKRSPYRQVILLRFHTLISLYTSISTYLKLFDSLSVANTLFMCIFNKSLL